MRPVPDKPSLKGELATKQPRATSTSDPPKVVMAHPGRPLRIIPRLMLIGEAA